MNLHPKAQPLLLAFWWTLSACSNTGFTSDAAKASHKPKKSEDSKVAAKDPTDDADQNNAGKDNSTDNANDQGDAPATADECLAKKADDYNIMLIFDNSGSQRETDPNYVRRNGAIHFVERFSEFVSGNKQIQVNVGVLSFNTQSIRSQVPWTHLTGTNSGAVTAEITQATSNPEGGTAYSPALNDAAKLFQQLPSSGRERNYVVFLTDGMPNAASSLAAMFPNAFIGGITEKVEDIPVAVDNLVKNHGVAMIAIASGPGIPPEGETLTRSLAQPTVGLKDKDHVGKYFRARTPEDLQQVWDSLFAQIGTCN